MKGPDIFERSGKVVTDSLLVSFLYELLREHVPGVIEDIVHNTELRTESDGSIKHHLSNGWLAQYAEDVAARLVPDDGTETKKEFMSSLGTLSNEWRNLAGRLSIADKDSATILRKCAAELSARISWASQKRS